MSGILSDARYALRTLVRYPRFNVAALLLLALGIGANIFIFSILDGARVQGHAPPAAAIGEIEISGWLLAGLLGCTLLLICANVARLLLVRDAARRRELALRGALGASRSRLVRQLLTESVILALLGGGAGLLLAAAGIGLAAALAPAGPGRLPQFQVNGRVVLYAAALALAAGYACGLLPALRVTLGGLREGLRASGPAGPAAPRRRRRPRRWFLAGEMALALVWLASAGLEIKNFYLFMVIDPGFAPRRAVLTASVQLPASPGGRYAGSDVRADFFQRLLERAARLPGVAAAAAMSSLPTGSTEDMPFTIDGSTALAGPATPRARVIQVTPGCFQVLGVPVRRGRPFGADGTGDTRGSDRQLPSAIVNQEFVREYFPGNEPLGRRLVFSSLPGPAAWQIVGVVADVRQDGMESPAPAIVYLPYWQDAPLRLAGSGVSMNLLLRSAGDRDAAFLAAPLRQALATIDPELALADPRTAAELFDRMATCSHRPRLLLLTLFAGFFVALAAAGIYGAVSGSVAQRSREIAIREAVGANRRAVLREVIREGVALASLGTALGLGAFVVFGLGLSNLCMPLEGDRLWYGPAMGVLAALSMLAVGALASWLPAARAGRLDLSAALRDG